MSHQEHFIVHLITQLLNHVTHIFLMARARAVSTLSLGLQEKAYLLCCWL